MVDLDTGGEQLTRLSNQTPSSLSRVSQTNTWLINLHNLKTNSSNMTVAVNSNVTVAVTISPSGWVPVSAKQNDRSIDLAFTSFLRYLVEKKLNLEQVTCLLKQLRDRVMKLFKTNAKFVLI